ncbi:MAG: HAD family hydrolase [Bacilli bacterium]|nr:HAD family hydrolase [Bacilli bacterium]
MIKRIIFDLDNTIILWKDEYVEALKKTMKEFDIDVDYKIIDKVIEEQEKIRKILTKEILLQDINRNTNLNLDIEFINKLLINQSTLAPQNDEKMIELFTYLDKKYEIVLLTNYFKEAQVGRLKTLGIDKFFKEFYGCEEITLKPNKEAFIKAIGPYKPNECLMIGDNYEVDIKGAKVLNINVIQVDLKNKIKEKQKHKVIKSLYELKEML